MKVDAMINLYCGNCMDFLVPQESITVTDPPFNIGYHYRSYKDKMDEDEYIDMLDKVFSERFVVIHYPETIYKIALKRGIAPKRVVSWVYNSNTGRQHRDIAFFNIVPDFSKVKQPYKNPNDKRIKRRILEGKDGAKLYDWWNVNQVKNISTEKTGHPCQMPLEIMENIIKILPDECTICDPFMGSGTTGVACVNTDRNFIGIELDEIYFDIARKRIADAEKKRMNMLF